MVAFTQNEIHEIYSIAYLNRGYIDPIDCRPTVSDANWQKVGRQSADFVCDFSCFLESTGCQKIITDQGFFYRSADCLWDLANGLELADRLTTNGRSSVDGWLTVR